jgi:hypothetical protein
LHKGRRGIVVLCLLITSAVGGVKAQTAVPLPIDENGVANVITAGKYETPDDWNILQGEDIISHTVKIDIGKANPNSVLI